MNSKCVRVRLLFKALEHLLELSTGHKTPKNIKKLIGIVLSSSFLQEIEFEYVFFGLFFQSMLDVKPPLGVQEISQTKKTSGVLSQHQLKVSKMNQRI